MGLADLEHLTDARNELVGRYAEAQDDDWVRRRFGSLIEPRVPRRR